MELFGERDAILQLWKYSKTRINHHHYHRCIYSMKDHSLSLLEFAHLESILKISESNLSSIPFSWIISCGGVFYTFHETSVIFAVLQRNQRPIGAA